MNHSPATQAAVVARRQAAVDRTEPISVLPLSVRPRTRLVGAGIDTIGKLAATPDDVMLALPNFGERSLTEVHQLLDEYLETVQQTEAALVTPADPATAAVIGHLRRLATAAHDDSVSTIGQFVMALGNQPRPSWVGDDLDSLLTTPLEVLADPTLAPHYGWRDAMVTILEAVNGTSRAAVLDTSVLRPGGPRTLEEVGRAHDLTRERIRQLRVKTTKRLGDQPAVAAAAQLFSRLLDPACPASMLIERGFDPGDELVQILATVATFNEWLSGNIWSDTIVDQTWYGTGTAPSDWMTETVHRAEGGVSVADLDEAFGLKFPHAAPNVMHTILRRSNNLQVLGHRVVDWSGSMLDKALFVLEQHGEPMTTEELVALIEPTSERGMLNQLYVERKNGSRIVWTVDKLWALPDWDVDAYTKGEDLMAQIIEESGGKVSLRRLSKEVQARGGFKPSSVQMWATMSPRFVYEDQAVRCRRPDEPIPVPPASATGDVYRRLDDPERGSWSTTITINYESIRTNSTAVPLAFVTLLGVEFGADLGQTITCNSIDVGVSWRMNNLRLHSSAGWRTVCETLGAKDGDELVFTATGPGTAQARLLPPAGDDLSPTATIRRLIGGDGTDDILTDVAWAIGFDGQLDDDFTIDDINARLADRRDHDLRDALATIHPELDL